MKRQTLQELLFNASKRKDLTVVQLQEFYQELKRLPTPILTGKQKYASPADLAFHMTRNSKQKWNRAPHLDLLSDKIVDVVHGRTPRLLVSMPPRHGKSELISYWTPIWLLHRDPTTRIVVASYEQDFAARWGGRVRDYIIERGDELNITISGSSKSRHDWTVVEGEGIGGMFSTGAGGPLTGRGADLLIIDDPIKNSEEAASSVQREKLWDWFQSTAFTRLEPGGGVIIVATRWHEDDLLGRIEAHSRNGTGLKWDIINFPAEAEDEDPLGRPLGAALWPSRYPKTEEEAQSMGQPGQSLEAIKMGVSAAEVDQDMSPYKWAAMYQGHPTPDEGGIIKKDWIRWYTELPEDIDQWCMSWDLAFKDAEKSSYVVGQVWARKNAEYYLVDQVRGRWDFPRTILEFRRLCSRYPQVGHKLVEDKANGPALIASLRREIPGIIPVQVKGSKDARLSAVSYLLEAGNVYFPVSSLAPWVHELVHELCSFPNATYDDQADCLSQMLNYLKRGGYIAFDRDWKEALNRPPPKDNVEATARAFDTWKTRTLKMSAKRMNRKMRGSIRLKGLTSK